MKDGSIPLDHLFAYEGRPLLDAFIEERFSEKITPRSRNVSPTIPAEISPETEAALRRSRAEEFALYERLVNAGGYLKAIPE